MNVVLRNRHFRRLFLGRLVTNAGDSLYAVAAMWLVYDLTGSPFYTGVAAFLTFGPSALQVFAGPLVDRWSLRRSLVGTQLTQLCLVLVVPLVHWTGHLTVWVVLTVMPLVALSNQFVYPASNAAVPRLVPKERLVAANSAMSFAYQGVDLAFNAVAGVLVAVLGAVALYLVDSVTFAAAAVLFATLRFADDEGVKEEPPEAMAVVESYRRDLREGVAYVRGSVVLPLVAAGAVANFTFGGVFAVLPAFAAERGGPETYGFLMAAVAGGLLAGALVASAFEGWPYGRLSIVGFGAGSALWFAAIAAPWLPLTAGLLALALVPVGVTNVVGNAMIQQLVPDGLLGRVTAVVNSVSALMTPVGAILGGTVAEVGGAAPVMAGGAAGLVFVAAYVLAHPALRQLPAVGELETLERAPVAD